MRIAPALLAAGVATGVLPGASAGSGADADADADVVVTAVDGVLTPARVFASPDLSGRARTASRWRRTVRR